MLAGSPLWRGGLVAQPARSRRSNAHTGTPLREDHRARTGCRAGCPCSETIPLIRFGNGWPILRCFNGFLPQGCCRRGSTASGFSSYEDEASLSRAVSIAKPTGCATRLQQTRGGMRSGFPGNPGSTESLLARGKFPFGAETRGATENDLEPLRLKRGKVGTDCPLLGQSYPPFRTSTCRLSGHTALHFVCVLASEFSGQHPHMPLSSLVCFRLRSHPSSQADWVSRTVPPVIPLPVPPYVLRRCGLRTPLQLHVE
jgi:hypothetical protein